MSFDALPTEILNAVLAEVCELCWFARPVLRAVCQQWAAAPAAAVAPMPRQAGLPLLFRLAREGQTRLIEWAVRGDEARRVSLAEKVLLGAAAGGHEDLARLARKWGARGASDALAIAAKRGHRHIVLLALQWGASSPDEGMIQAAAGGHEDLVYELNVWCHRLVPGWRIRTHNTASTYYSWVMYEAARRGLKTLMWWAWDRIRTQSPFAVSRYRVLTMAAWHAAIGRQYDLLYTIAAMGHLDYEELALRAVTDGRPGALEFASARGGLDPAYLGSLAPLSEMLLGPEDWGTPQERAAVVALQDGWRNAAGAQNGDAAAANI